MNLLFTCVLGVVFVAGTESPMNAQRVAPAAVASHRHRSEAVVVQRIHKDAFSSGHDSARVSHRRATIVGGFAGGVVGGLGGTAIGLTQNAYDCVTTAPACPRKPDHTLLYGSGGVVVGAALGAWFIHSIWSAGWRR